MQLIDLDTSQMVFDPKAKDFMEKMYTIPNYKDRSPSPYGHRTIATYIVLMYDPNSPVREEIDDPWKARHACLEAAGYTARKHKRGKFIPEAEDIVTGRATVINELTLDFLAHIGRTVWTQRVYLTETLMHHTMDVLNGGKSNAADIKTVGDLYEKIQKVDNIILRENYIEDTPKRLLEKLYRRLEDMRLRLRVEDIVQRLNSGDELLEYSPYGENYKPEKIKYNEKFNPEAD